jgi:hypothetical protein
MVHLFGCSACRTRRAGLEPFVSATRSALRQLRDDPLDFHTLHEDGPVRLLVDANDSGEWRATFAGHELRGALRFSDVNNANEQLMMEVFRWMFPKHVCDQRCR